MSETPGEGPVRLVRIEEYELVEEIGRGAMGAIHRARDTLLDRDVALKLIDAPPLAIDPETRARFFREARALARVAHANVVGIFRVGEVDGQPYLVTELVRGGTLEDLPKPIPWSRALVFGAGVSRGLAAAHKKSVLHRDIKPANVMWSDEGAIKLVDFGVAKLLEEAEPGRPREIARVDAGARVSWASQAGEIAGTPLYMAPEVLLGGAATVQSDIYGVGAILYELVVGVAPRDTLSADLPLLSWISMSPRAIDVGAGPGAVDPRFARVVSRCVAAAPRERFASADALAEALEALIQGEESVDVEGENPYRGLEPFEVEHRGAFFGREVETRALVARLRDRSLVVVAGDSGVGKSSLCKAGVLPRLGASAAERGRALRIAALVPGARPLRALEEALTPVLPGDALDLTVLLDADPAALYRALARGLAPEEDLLLFVDQLEELCTLSEPGEAARFGEALRGACAGPRVRVLATLRGDFIVQMATVGPLGAELAECLFLLRPMSEDGIRAAIVKPALRKGVRFESEALVDSLVSAAVETPGGLPLLEFALAELWSERDEASGVLSARELRAIGSVSGALARHADAVLSALDPAARAAAKRVLLDLSRSDLTRARRTLEELGGGEPGTRTALDALVRGRLIVARGLGEERVYEVAHEALIREWQTLRRWIEETQEQRQFLQEMEQAAELWARRGRREEETWTDEALDQAVRRVEKWTLLLPPVSRDFLAAGVTRRRAATRRRRWILGGAAAALGMIAMVSTAAAIKFAEKEKQAIQQQAQIRLAAADMGEFELSLEPFDWDAATQRASPASATATLDWRVYAVSPSDAHAVGRPYGSDDIRRSARRLEGNVLHERVEARSGPAFLEVTGRGEGCASSWVYLQHLPGYTDRVQSAPPVVHLAVPSCQASREAMIPIPAGAFMRAVLVDEQSDEWRDQPASLPAFRIDRTEVTRGAFATYAALEPLTGEVVARTAYLDLDRPGGERLPVVGVNALTAANHCRFWGKELPSVDQWLKALRGGLTVDGAPNPDPVRNTPWGKTAAKYPSNLLVDEPGDGFPNLAPVGAFPEDRSPHGVMDLGGNVREWTRDAVELPRVRGLRFVLGASWDTPVEHASWGNMRPDRYLDFAIGIRCVEP